MKFSYKGIELENLEKDVNLYHSNALHSVGIDKNINTDYLDNLMSIKRAEVSSEQFDEINKLHSVIKMNYQICNGGIEQYFFNGYDKPWISEDKETELFDKTVQVSVLRKLHDFAIEVNPENSAENSKFARIIDFFDSLYVEKDVPQMEMIYSDEDEYLVDEETGDWIENPDYEEPYEECVGHEDEIRSDAFYVDNFDKDYYEINDYIENVIEGYAQYLTKSIERERVVDDLLNTHADASFHYRMLSRMQSDCEYFLGNGNRYAGHLWGKNVSNHIYYMKALWNSFPQEGKPEWLSMEQICDYEKKMLEKKPSLADKIQSAESRVASHDESNEKNNTYER